ncbi:MAG TPA: hypothetical protein ENK15_06420, partial [Thermopetrobacter sp.]|nr:hypothetical protein [Thermopetrobacter sp.]
MTGMRFHHTRHANRFAISASLLALALIAPTMQPAPALAGNECLLDLDGSNVPSAGDGPAGATAFGSLHNTACGTFADASGGGVGSRNTATGYNANASGDSSRNTASGANADASGGESFNTATGTSANASGNDS